MSCKFADLLVCVTLKHVNADTISLTSSKTAAASERCFPLLLHKPAPGHLSHYNVVSSFFGGLNEFHPVEPPLLKGNLGIAEQNDMKGNF